MKSQYSETARRRPLRPWHGKVSNCMAVVRPKRVKAVLLRSPSTLSTAWIHPTRSCQSARSSARHKPRSRRCVTQQEATAQLQGTYPIQGMFRISHMGRLLRICRIRGYRLSAWSTTRLEAYRFAAEEFVHFAVWEHGYARSRVSADRDVEETDI